MSFASIRYSVLAFLILFNALTGTTAAWNLGLALNHARPGTETFVENTDGFLMASGVLGILLIFAIIAVDALRKGAITGKVWFELCWVGLFWTFNLIGMAVSMGRVPGDTRCGVSRATFCQSTQALIIITWLNMFLHLGYLVFFFGLCFLRSSRDRNVWTASLSEYTWFPKDSQSTGNIEPTYQWNGPTQPSFYQNSTDPRYSESTLNLEKKLSDMSMIIPVNYGQNTGMAGVAAINGAPAYYPQASYNSSQQPSVPQPSPAKPQKPPSFSVPVPPRPSVLPATHSTFHTLNMKGLSVAGSAALNPDSAFHQTSPIPPSPAVIQSVQRVVGPAVAVVQKASLYPQAVSSVAPAAKQTSRRRSSDPTRLPGVDSQSQTSRNLLNAVNTTNATAARRGHGASLSTDSAFNQRRKHRPPPLDLSALSNIASADRR